VRLIWKWAVLGIGLQLLESEMYLYSNLKIHYQCVSTASAVRKKANHLIVSVTESLFVIKIVQNT
jgi:hypothetical protein